MQNHPAVVTSSSSNPPECRVLVADDDPASCRFLGDAMHSLGWYVEACHEGMHALERACSDAFDLLLLDCRMPGAGALEILTRLRQNVGAGSAGSPAIATTADLEASERRQLLDAGFSDILLKPCTVAELQRVLGLLGLNPPGAPVLDDHAALTSTGDATTMRALRLLLREELIVLQQELDPLSQDAAAFGERLHRLRSSCGFCGASALAAEATSLQQRPARHDAASLRRFRKALRATLQALDE